jgi:O-acetyl-ADP-ribose deacetylase (regulator of RNase III)
MPVDGTRDCFIIMPFGMKMDHDGNEIDFDDVYRELIQGPVQALGYHPLRSDEIVAAGSILRDMFTHIARDDLVIVDITTLNPNVFYELGVRHALRPAVTVLIKHRGTSVPFNIHGQRAIEYPDESGAYDQSRATIMRSIQDSLEATAPDSPIFSILQDARKDWKTERILHLEQYHYRLRSSPARRITIITGDLREWRDIDVWVNSENTNMQMARFYDQSLSAIIRYEGAEKDDNGEVVEDSIADELTRMVAGRGSVTPGAVYVTGPGALAKTRNVKKIFHAATVHGVPGGGYRVINNVETCVTTSLRRVDHERYRHDDLRTIVFPMMGTGLGGGDVYVVAPRLIRAAVSYLSSYPETNASTVFFSAWNHRDLDACLAAMRSIREIEAWDGNAEPGRSDG